MGSAQGRSPSRPTQRRPHLVSVSDRRSRPWRWFCGYCGAPPPRGHRPPPFTRVCEACGLGLLLEAPAEAAPGPGEVFLVIDRDLVVRGVSKAAEAELGIREPEVVGQTVDGLLPLAAQRGRLHVSLERAASGDDQLRHASVLLGDGQRPRRARISCCGPPAAAMVVLER